MSENTQDHFAHNATEASAKAFPLDEQIAPQMEQPAGVEQASSGEEASDHEEAQSLTEQPDEAEPVPAPENTLPPEAQGEVNGGPLGCCLGTMVGILLLSLSLAVLSRLYATPLGSILQGNYGLLGLIVRILMSIVAFSCAILLGYLGWKLGKRFYREYEPPVRPSRTRAKKLRQEA